MNETYDSLSRITAACKYLLQNNYKPEINSILDQRIDRKTQNIFDFGYYPSSIDINLLTSLIDKNDLIKNNLLYTRKINDSLFPREIDCSYFENYEIIMPYKNQYGDIVGLVGRTILSEAEQKENNISKYLNTKNIKKSKYLFGLHENKNTILNRSFAYIVEGQFDVIKAYESNLQNVVALGCSNMSFRQISLIKRYCNKIYLLLDNDDAGEKGRKKIIEKYSKYITIKNAYVPEKYKDLDEYLKTKPKNINITHDF